MVVPFHHHTHAGRDIDGKGQITASVAPPPLHFISQQQTNMECLSVLIGCTDSDNDSTAAVIFLDAWNGTRKSSKTILILPGNNFQ
eukprot:scaffold5885_cov201-Amphora_coffeaeformis.AAC.21